jgi:hypothetical protein
MVGVGEWSENVGMLRRTNVEYGGVASALAFGMSESELFLAIRMVERISGSALRPWSECRCGGLMDESR